MASRRFELIPPASGSDCPLERSGHRILVDDGNMYVLGGYNPVVVDESTVEDEEELCKRIFVEMWRFNFFLRQWRQLQMTGDCPKYLASHSASLHGKTILTFGGSGIPFGERSSQSLHMCQVDPNSDSVQWKLLKSWGIEPQRKYGQCQLYQWPYLYIVGGTTGFVYNSDVHCYDMQTGGWTCLWDSQASEENFSQSPIGRYRHEMVLHDQKLLMFGGGQSRCCFGLYEIPYFDLESRKWKELQTTPDPSLTHNSQLLDDIKKGVPMPRRCHSCVHYQNAVYVFGGRAQEPFGDLWRLCLDTFQWTCLQRQQSSIIRLYFHSADVTSSGSMYVFGGVTWVNSVDVRTHAIYRVRLAVPSLQELAWDCLGDCLRSWCRHPQHLLTLPQRLLEAGVPRQFVDRLVH